MIEDLGELVVRPYRNPIAPPKPGRTESKHIRFNREQIEKLPCRNCPKQINCQDTDCMLFNAYKRGENVPIRLIQMLKG